MCKPCSLHHETRQLCVCTCHFSVCGEKNQNAAISWSTHTPESTTRTRLSTGLKRFAIWELNPGSIGPPPAGTHSISTDSISTDSIRAMSARSVCTPLACLCCCVGERSCNITIAAGFSATSIQGPPQQPPERAGTTLPRHSEFMVPTRALHALPRCTS